ncbi:hypothetical protein ALQ57_200016 [Pseudomonas amygdali pv. hibisci]|nr:hypothetical protein ALQ57_200016 [Pseudomonas amygdali pv. hibisci]
MSCRRDMRHRLIEGLNYRRKCLKLLHCMQLTLNCDDHQMQTLHTYIRRRMKTSKTKN